MEISSKNLKFWGKTVKKFIKSLFLGVILLGSFCTGLQASRRRVQRVEKKRISYREQAAIDFLKELAYTDLNKIQRDNLKEKRFRQHRGLSKDFSLQPLSRDKILRDLFDYIIATINKFSPNTAPMRSEKGYTIFAAITEKMRKKKTMIEGREEKSRILANRYKHLFAEVKKLADEYILTDDSSKKIDNYLLDKRNEFFKEVYDYYQIIKEEVTRERVGYGTGSRMNLMEQMVTIARREGKDFETEDKIVLKSTQKDYKKALLGSAYGEEFVSNFPDELHFVKKVGNAYVGNAYIGQISGLLQKDLLCGYFAITAMILLGMCDNLDVLIKAVSDKRLEILVEKLYLYIDEYRTMSGGQEFKSGYLLNEEADKFLLAGTGKQFGSIALPYSDNILGSVINHSPSPEDNTQRRVGLRNAIKARYAGYDRKNNPIDNFCKSYKPAIFAVWYGEHIVPVMVCPVRDGETNRDNKLGVLILDFSWFTQDNFGSPAVLDRSAFWTTFFTDLMSPNVFGGRRGRRAVRKKE